jgi:hypothetical protein
MSFAHNVYAVEESESVLRESFEQVMRNQGLTDEDLARLNDLGIFEINVLASVTEDDLVPSSMGATDVDLSWLSDTQKCQLLRLTYLARKLEKEYDWLTDEERYQLFLHGDVNLITEGHGATCCCSRCRHAKRHQQQLKELMRHVEDSANGWLNNHILNARLEKLEELIEWVRVWD